MTQTTTIDGVSRTAVIKRNRCEWVEHAYLGEIGSGTLVIHDDSSAISVVGHKTIITEQSACTPARLFTGFVGQKTFGRGDQYTATLGREITVATKDGNDLLTRYIITGTDGKRSAETVGDRVEWLLASDYLSTLVVDDGAVTYPSDISLDATDYRGQRAGDVLAACAKKANFNYYVRWTGTEFELVFRDDNASTDDTSSITITNDGTANSTSSFAPFQDSQLTEDPEDVYSGAYASYAKGSVYRTRAATATAFVARDGTTEDSGIKTAAQATDQADTFLWESHTEEHSLTLTLRMRADYVNLILAGQRVSVKLTHLATQGYDSATYFRVLRRRVHQPLDTDNDYDVQLDLSPQEEGPPVAGIVQSVFGHTTEGGGTFTFANPVTIGNSLVFVISDTAEPNPPPPNTSPSIPRWGEDPWTKTPNVGVDDGSGLGGTGNGVAIYVKTSDSTEQSCYVGASNAAVGCYEIAGGDVGSATTIYETDQSAAQPMIVGTFTAAPAGSVAIMIGNWYDSNAPFPPTPPPDPTWTGTANGWTTDLLYWIHATYPYWDPPISWIAHATGDGGDLVAAGTRSSLYFRTGEWCGVAILIPPL